MTKKTLAFLTAMLFFGCTHQEEYIHYRHSEGKIISMENNDAANTIYVNGTYRFDGVDGFSTDLSKGFYTADSDRQVEVIFDFTTKWTLYGGSVDAGVCEIQLVQFTGYNNSPKVQYSQFLPYTQDGLLQHKMNLSIAMKKDEKLSFRTRINATVRGVNNVETPGAKISLQTHSLTLLSVDGVSCGLQ